jgi:hypothetical protein
VYESSTEFWHIWRKTERTRKHWQSHKNQRPIFLFQWFTEQVGEIDKVTKVLSDTFNQQYLTYIYRIFTSIQKNTNSSQMPWNIPQHSSHLVKKTNLNKFKRIEIIIVFFLIQCNQTEINFRTVSGKHSNLLKYSISLDQWSKVKVSRK